MSSKISIRPAEMSLEQAVSFCHMLDYEGRQSFLGILTNEESEAIEKALFDVNDKVIIKRCDGTKCNGAVVAIGKIGYYRVAYTIYNQVSVSNLHHSRIRLGQLDKETETETE